MFVFLKKNESSNVFFCEVRGLEKIHLTTHFLYKNLSNYATVQQSLNFGVLATFSLLKQSSVAYKIRIMIKARVS